MEIIERIVADELAAALRYNTNREVTEDEKAAYCARRRVHWQSVADMVTDKPEVYRRALRGAFHRSNKNTRRIFTAITGVKLPPTSGGTMSTLIEYVGPEAITVVEAEHAAKAAARQAEIDAKQAAEDAAHAAKMETLKAKVSADEMIGGGDLIDLARHLDIDVHPRTVGACRKRVVEINSYRARIYGGAVPDKVRSLYRTVAQYLKEPVTVDDCDDAEVKRLFGC